MNADLLPAKKKSLRQYLRLRFRKWVNRRIPPAREVTLNQKRIFIFPSYAGLFFIFCLVVMLLTAINFQNNLSYAVTFLLATLFVIATLHTYANLSGLIIRALKAEPAFPGQQSEFSLMIERSKRRQHFALHVKWPESSEGLINLLEQDSEEVRLHMPVGERGWFKPERLLVESSYPLGLLRCWTWIDLDLRAMVYPRPLASIEPAGAATDTVDEATTPVTGSDDFYGIRDYHRGDSLRHIHWKGLAKGQGLQSKQYTTYAERSLWLDWEAFQGLGVEQRLSHLCYWALELESRGDDYGLHLPGTTIDPDSGDRHRDAVLRALALYGKEGAPV